MPYGKKTAYKKKGCFKMKGPSLYKLNVKSKSNKPCPGCSTTCPSCKGNKTVPTDTEARKARKEKYMKTGK